MKQRLWWMAAMGLMVCGCGHSEPRPRHESAKEFANALFNPVTQTKEEQERHARAFESRGMKPVSGKGTLVAIDQNLGIGTLEIRGKQVRFWWKNRGELASVGEQAEKSPEAQETEAPFKAEPGDTVYFKGFESHGEIYFTAAAAVRGK
jgi:hypothetical protein